MKYLYCFLMILFFFSCQDQANKKSENEDILIVNIDDLKFQTVDWGQMFDLSSLEVIPLETTSQSIFNNALRFLVCDSMYCVMTSLAVLTFDSEGHFVKKLSKGGRGPGEYLGLMDIWMGENQDLYLLDCHGNKILSYTKADSLKMSIPTGLFGYAFAQLTDDIWSIYVDSDVRESSNCRLNLFSLSQQKIIQKYQPVTEYEKEWRYSRDRNNFIQYDSTLFYRCAFNDTIYRLSKESLEPAVIIDYGEHRIPAKLLQRKYENIAEVMQLLQKSNWICDTDPVYFTDEGIFVGFLYQERYYPCYYKDGKSMIAETYENYLGLKGYSVSSDYAGIPLACKDGYLYSLVDAVWIKEEFREEFAKKFGIAKFEEDANPYILKYKLKGNIDVYKD